MAIAVQRHAPSRAPRPTAAPPSRQLRVVAGGRRAVRFGVVLGVALFGVMFAVTAFQTRLAENQLQVDETEQAIAEQRKLYDQLRMESATLRSPQRLTEEATKLGMVPAGNVEFVETDPSAIAAVEVATADLDDEQALAPPGPFEDYGTVKAGVDGAP
jgi:cell division protein FtsL